jgi:hypothetical protein
MICTRIGVLCAYGKIIDTIADIEVDNNSLDIAITGVTINGTAITYSSGNNFTITAGQAGAFTTPELGTYTVAISYTYTTAGQSLFFLDSNNTGTCVNATTSPATFTINNAVIKAVHNTVTVGIYANNGVCS